MMKRLAKAGHKAAAAAVEVNTEPPPDLAHLVYWYSEIRGQAQRGQYFEPMDISEAREYVAAFELEAGPFEYDILLRLDRIWRRLQPKPGDKDGKSR